MAQKEISSTTKNRNFGLAILRTNAISAVNDTIESMYKLLNNQKDKYDQKALDYAKTMTMNYFECLINSMSAHGGVKNGDWGSTAKFTTSDGVYHEVNYAQESHQGYIDYEKNSADGDPIQWNRGTMAGARFAKISISKQTIFNKFNDYYKAAVGK